MAVEGRNAGNVGNARGIVDVDVVGGEKEEGFDSRTDFDVDSDVDLDLEGQRREKGVYFGDGNSDYECSVGSGYERSEVASV